MIAPRRSLALQLHAGALVAALPLLAGCLERQVKITSEPAGALVTVNGTEVGRTPLTASFENFGAFDVQARKEGYVTASGPQRARTPIYEFPPIDLAATALPVTITTRRHWHIELTPEVDPQSQTPEARRADESALIERAQELRTRTLPPEPSPRP
jgi:hypothetical protein